jgi:histidine triad (HIT) family protein
MDQCVFCSIAAGQAPASIIYRDDLCLAFMDIRPVNPGHLLVIPLAHAAFLCDLDPGSGAAMFRASHRLAAALRRSGRKAEGVNMFLADGEAAGQEVFHVHMHVFPRFRGDGFGLRFGPDYGQLPPRAELDETAKAIGSALAV